MRNTEIQPVDVGQLLAALVHLPEVRVALHDHAGYAAGVRLGHHPWVQRGLIHVAPACRNFNVSALVAKQPGPVRLIGRFGLGTRVRVVLGVELTAIVFGKQGGVLTQGRRQMLQKHGVRTAKGEFDRCLIHLHDLCRFAANHQRGGNGLVQLAILGAIFN